MGKLRKKDVNGQTPKKDVNGQTPQKDVNGQTQKDVYGQTPQADVSGLNEFMALSPVSSHQVAATALCISWQQNQISFNTDHHPPKEHFR